MDVFSRFLRIRIRSRSVIDLIKLSCASQYIPDPLKTVHKNCLVCVTPATPKHAYGNFYIDNKLKTICSV